MSTLYGDIDGTSYPTKKDTVYFVLATIRTTPVEMVSRFWGDKSVEKPFIDTASSLYRDGQAPYELIDKGHVVAAAQGMHYEDTVTSVGSWHRHLRANRSHQRAKGYVWLHIWEVAQADIEHLQRLPSAGAAQPHPWEYAFKRKQAVSPLTPDQLTLQWAPWHARGLTDPQAVIIRLLDRDSCCSQAFIASIYEL